MTNYVRIIKTVRKNNYWLSVQDKNLVYFTFTCKRWSLLEGKLLLTCSPESLTVDCQGLQKGHPLELPGAVGSR